MKNLYYLFSILIATTLSPLFAQTSLADEQVYSVGVVPQFEARLINKIWTPILQEVSRISEVKLKLSGSPSIPEFEREFESGNYHFAYMNPYHAIVANDKQGYEPILRDTSKRLRGIIVVKKDSPLSDVKQLDGKKVAMPAPNALGAALLPRSEFSTIFKIKPDISYVKSHNSVYLNVVLGAADAGGGVMGTFNRQSPQIRDKLRILYKTRGVAAHPLTAHPSVPADVIKRVQAAFLELGKSESGKALLAQIPIKQIGATKMADYQVLKEMGLERFYVKKKKK